jgi:hypothetical protein
VDSYGEVRHQGFWSRIKARQSSARQPVHPTGHGPTEKQKGNAKNKTQRSRMRGASYEFPLDRKHTLTEVSERPESTMRQVDGILVITSGAFIRHDHGDALASLRVGDLHLVSANGLAIQCRIF